MRAAASLAAVVLALVASACSVPRTPAVSGAARLERPGSFAKLIDRQEGGVQTERS